MPQAVEDARENARRAGMDNVRFLCADAGQAAQQLAREGLRPDVIVVDPPRKGIDGRTIDAILQMAPARVVYIACDCASLARDAAILRDKGGYGLTRVRAFDMFPRTANVETVVLLRRETIDHITVSLDVGKLSANAGAYATYPEIKAYVQGKFGLKVSSLYIAQVKEKYGIIERKNYNKPKSEDAKQPQCPPEKEKAIAEALKHFGMIAG